MTELNFTCPICHAREIFHNQAQFDMIVRHMAAHAAGVTATARQVWERNLGSIGDGCQWTEGHFERTMAQLVAAIRTSQALDMTEKYTMKGNLDLAVDCVKQLTAENAALRQQVEALEKGNAELREHNDGLAGTLMRKQNLHPVRKGEAS